MKTYGSHSRIRNRLLSILLVLAMVVTYMPVMSNGVWAETISTDEIQGVYYSASQGDLLNIEGETVYRYNSSEDGVKYIIPSDHRTENTITPMQDVTGYPTCGPFTVSKIGGVVTQMSSGTDVYKRYIVATQLNLNYMQSIDVETSDSSTDFFVNMAAKLLDKSHTATNNTAFMVYRKSGDQYYYVVKSGGTISTTTNEGGPYHSTFAEIKSRSLSYDDSTKVKVYALEQSEPHNWVYGVATTTNANDTLTAYCDIEGCTLGHTASNPVKLQLKSGSIYAGNKYTQAYVNTTNWLAAGLDVPWVSSETSNSDVALYRVATLGDLTGGELATNTGVVGSYYASVKAVSSQTDAAVIPVEIKNYDWTQALATITSIDIDMKDLDKSIAQQIAGFNNVSSGTVGEGNTAYVVYGLYDDNTTYKVMRIKKDEESVSEDKTLDQINAILAQANNTDKVYIVGAHVENIAGQIDILRDGNPIGTNTPKIGDKLTATSTELNATTYTCQWYRDDASITNATSTDYTVTEADAGHTLKAVFTGTGYYDSTDSSTPTSVVAEPVCKMGGKYYDSVSAAVASATDTELATVTMLKDSTENVKINGENIVLDLAGHTISCTNDSTIIYKGSGSLTINDSSADKTGAIKASGLSTRALYVDSGATGTVTINGGTFQGTSDSVKVTNLVKANVTINGGYFQQTVDGNTSNGTTVINGGYFVNKPQSYTLGTDTHLMSTSEIKDGVTYIYTFGKSVAELRTASETNYYMSVQNAITAAQEAGEDNLTVKMLSDSTENVTVSDSGNAVTLDLNGHILKASDTDSVITNYGTLTITDSNPSATHTFATNSDGLWALDDNGSIEVKGGCITGSKNDTFGGGIHNKGTLYLYGINVVGNKAGYGGGIFNRGCITASSTNIKGNTAEYGGGFCNYSYGTENTPVATLTDVNIEACTAEDSGGIAVNNGEVNWYNGTIKECTATKRGGGVYAYSDFNMHGGNISDCKASSGGGVYVASGTFVMNNSTITGCQAVGQYAAGGGVCVLAANFTMNSSTITDCTAQYQGGGVLISQASQGEFTMNASTITGCEAPSGGGIYNNGKNTTIASDSNVSSNIASNGGGIYNCDENLSIISSTITGNKALSEGSGVYAHGAKTIVGGNTKITGNIEVASETDTTGTNSNLCLWNTMLTLSTETTLSTDAKIGVTLEDYSTYTPTTGTFTNAIENAASYKEYFTSDSSDYHVKANATTLELISHVHSWKYNLATTTSTGDTIVATCTGTGDCDYTGTDTSLTIKATDTTYNGASHEATLTNSDGTEATSLVGQDSLPTITYEYKATSDGTFGRTNDTQKAGFYKASVTVGSGTDAVTASVEYKVAKKQLIASGTSIVAKTYDGTTVATATGTELVGVVDTDDVNVDVVATFTDKNASDTDIPVNVAYTLTGSRADNYALATSTEVLSGKINKKQLTATGTSVQDKTYDGTAVATATNATLEGVVSGDAGKVSVSMLASFSDAQADTNKSTTVVYSISGDEASNYIAPVTDTSLKATIHKKVVDLSWGPVEFTYDKQGHLPEATVTNLVGEDACNVTVEGTQTDANAKTGTDSYTATATGLDNSNYQLSSDTDKYTHSFIINQKVADLSWGTSEFTYDGKGHLPEATVSNLESGDSCDVTVEGTQTDANAKTSTTNYTATATKLSNKNYTLSTATDKFTKKFTIEQLTADLSWGDLVLTYNGKDQKPKATVTNLVGNDKCTVTIDGAQIDVGTYTATASDLGNKNYKLPASVTNTFTIKPLTAVLTWGADEFTYDGENHLPVASISNLQRTTDNPSVTVEGTQKNTNKYSKTDNYTATATELADDNYVLSTEPAEFTHKFTIGAKTIGLDWSNTSLIYNGQAQKPIASATQLVGSDTCIVTVTGEQTNAGSYTATAASVDNDNYKLPAKVTKAFTIAKKLITVSAGSYKVSKVYDSTTGPGEPSGDISVSGILSQDSNVYVKKGIIPRYQSQDVGTYSLTLPVTIEGDNDNNYKLDVKSIQVPGTITQKTIHVSADDQTSYVEEELNNLTYTSDELLGSDTFSGRLETNADKYNPGTYTIKQGSLTAGNNYKIEFQDGTYTVEDDEAEASLVATAHAYKKSIRLTWTEPNEQATYRVYIANCNKKNWKLVKTTTASAYTKKSLKAKKSYKMYVAAYDEDGKLIAKTPVVHCMTTGGKYSNATSVQATLNMTLTAGEVSYVDAKITKKSSKKTLLWKKHCAKIRYYSADNDVATVDADGNVTAVGHGIVNIYSVAPSGAYAVTTVKVINS